MNHLNTLGKETRYKDLIELKPCEHQEQEKLAQDRDSEQALSMRMVIRGNCKKDTNKLRTEN